MKDRGITFRNRAGIVVALVALVLAQIVGLLLPKAAYAAGSDEPSRTIAVAYDNSASMCWNTDRWCSAHYGLEVLAAMMGEGDELSLYTMDRPGEVLHLSGSTDVASRVSAVHGADLSVSGFTYPRVAQDAYAYLQGQSSDERYLVILTDGQFEVDDGSIQNDVVYQVIDQAASDGITVVFLGIGNDAAMPEADESRGIYVKKASDDAILSTMTEIANLVFGRASLDSSMYTDSGDIELEVPMGRLIVFAQGADVSVGDLTTPDGTVVSPDVANVRHVDEPFSPTGDEELDDFLDHAVVNDNLQGVVATYDVQMPKGSAKVDISGAESVEIYFQPYVDIALDLTSEEGFPYHLMPDEETTLTVGSYTVGYRFLDPYTGEELDSSLLNPADFSLTIDDGSHKQHVADGETIELEQGTVDMVASVETPGGGKARQKYNDIHVVPLAGALELTVVERPDEPVDIHELADSDPIVVHVTKEDGEELTEAEWDSVELSVRAVPGLNPMNIGKGLEFEIEQGDEVGDFNVYLRQHGRDVTTTLSGKVPLEITAVLNVEDGQYQGSIEDSVRITSPSILDVILHWIVIIVLILLGLLFILWLLGRGFISGDFRRSIVLNGPGVPANQTISMSKPKGITLIRQRSEGQGGWPIDADRGFAGRPIKLEGKLFRFGRAARFTNFEIWKKAGWRLVGPGSKEASPNNIYSGVNMTRGAYTVTFYKKRNKGRNRKKR